MTQRWLGLNQGAVPLKPPLATCWLLSANSGKQFASIYASFFLRLSSFLFFSFSRLINSQLSPPHLQESLSPLFMTTNTINKHWLKKRKKIHFFSSIIYKVLLNERDHLVCVLKWRAGQIITLFTIYSYYPFIVQKTKKKRNLISLSVFLKRINISEFLL